MEKIKITFLGTSDSIPTKLRNHPAILLAYKNENILIDCGEGTQRQFKIAEISPMKLTSILITHWHGDHTFGLPGLLQTLNMMNYNKKLKIYGPKGTRRYINLLKELANINLSLDVYELENNVFVDNSEFCIETKSMDHTSPTNAYSFKIKDKRRLDKQKLKKLKLPNSPIIKSLQQGKDIVYNNRKIKASQVSYIEKGRKVTIVLDTKLNQNAINLAKDSDILISESSFSSEDKDHAKEFKHLTATDAAVIAKKAKVKRLILTHVSQRYEGNISIIEKEAKKMFKNTSIAKDFDSLIV